ncbi:hypothetical protein BY458DRAFT_442365 [Sporodiniella umbellata]|nr:hypothetical protein BY458DRAFT_442365 [Sporodiniella umbellata]
MSLLEKVSEQLATLELKDEDIADYLTGIVTDESMAKEEKHAVMTEFLAEATEKETDAMIDSILAFGEQIQRLEQQKGEEKRLAVLEQVKVREQARREQDALEKQRELEHRSQPKVFTKEEKLARQKLMQDYAYVAEEEETIQTKNETDLKDRRRGKGNPSPVDPLMVANRNAEAIKEAEQNRREQMKQAHEKERERNKLNLEKQRSDQKADKEKKKTQKGERRR